MLDIRRCWLTTDPGNAIREARATGRGPRGSRPTTRPSSTGFLRHLVVREGRNTGQTLVQLVTAPGKLDVESFVAALTQFPEVRSIHWSVNDRPAEVTNLPTQLLFGDEAIEEQLCGLRFRVRRTRFCRRTRPWPSASTSSRASTRS